MNYQFLAFDDESVWSLADKVSCRSISDADFGAVWRYLDDIEDEQYRSLFDPKTKCIYFDQVSISGEIAKLFFYTCRLIKSANILKLHDRTLKKSQKRQFCSANIHRPFVLLFTVLIL
jgi:hypothetical protein